MLYFDTEGIGLLGPTTLIQYAIDEGPVELHSCWKRPARDTLDLIEQIVDHPHIVGFNLTFDWFMLTKLYNMFRKLPPGYIPEEHIRELQDIEVDCRKGALCLNPNAATDLMVVAREGVYQNTMAREPIRIKRVPTQLASKLKEELEGRVQIPGLYFAKRKNASNERWTLHDCNDQWGEYDPRFKDVVLSFAPSTALKALAADALQAEDIILHDDLEVPPHFKWEQDAYVPFAGKTGVNGVSYGNWPKVIQFFIDRWAYNPLCRRYAEDDVIYTRGLYHWFKDPQPDETSMLACAIGTTRWNGFAVDVPALRKLSEVAEERMIGVPRDPARAKAWIEEVMTDDQKLILTSTNKEILSVIGEWKDAAGDRARMVSQARQAFYNKNYFDKVIATERFHAAFNVMGTKSARMSGEGGLNAQGLKRDVAIRSAFTLADPGELLSGGDFDAFEPGIAATVYYDEGLMKVLLPKSRGGEGKNFHVVFGMSMFPNLTYEELADKKTHGEEYSKAKMGDLLTFYGGQAFSLARKANISEDNARLSQEDFFNKFPGVRRAQAEIAERFTCIKQPDGIGSKIIWQEPEEYVETILGTRRYFTLENEVKRALFDLASDAPPEWKELKFKVTRRDREQTASGAAMSAIYAAVFALQSANIREACNHVVQSTGAKVCKMEQYKLWELQPKGIGPFKIKMLNVHDEILAVHDSSIRSSVFNTQKYFIDEMREKLPLLSQEWKEMKSWGEK